MRLISLEMHGFKSFADPQKLTFPEGMTAVVGPNGCGKSNITDALAWVLGEQRASLLRGAEMSDVIFAGTSDRRATGMAEVKLSIEMPAANIADDAILFEPLHTTDYFASVGIKLSEEAKPEDKLGKQLKSFTEWLKTMKKIHAEQLTKASTPAEIEADNTESNIQQLAEKSNIDNDVVTEAMAEVLLQQGRTKKAIEVLEKLSLLNPAKSAFFAAKINQIKEP